MSTDLRQRLFLTFESGSIEELSTLLFLIHLKSLRPKNSNAAVDFQVHSGCCKLSDEEPKLEHLSLP